MAVQPAVLANALRDRYTLERELGRGGMATVYLAALRQAWALDPLGPSIAAGLGRMLRDLEQYDAAIEECGRAIELQPGYAVGEVCLGDALLAAGRPAEALAAFQRASGYLDYAKAGVARAHVALGRPDQARRIVAQMEREAGQRFFRPDVIALVYVSLGDRDAAFRWLERAYEARSRLLIRLTTNWQWDPIRSDPRFQALVEKIGLVSPEPP